jgi:hypothetical protein
MMRITPHGPPGFDLRKGQMSVPTQGVATRGVRKFEAGLIVLGVGAVLLLIGPFLGLVSAPLAGDPRTGVEPDPDSSRTVLRTKRS